MRIRAIVITVLGLLPVAILIGAMLWHQHWKYHPHSLSESVLVTIEPGEPYSVISRKLEDHGLVRFPTLFYLLVRSEGKIESFQAGEYRFQDEISPNDLIDKFVLGDVTEYQVMLPEGGTYERYKSILQSTPKLNFDLQGISVSKVLELWSELPDVVDRESAHGEGWFYPATYDFRADETASDVLRKSLNKMSDELQYVWSQRNNDSPLNDPYELLILASIVEKESSRVSDQKEIAGVFVRRLQNRMYLQADPTVIYGLGDAFDGDLTREHLRTHTDYNTYLFRGLPPTPIASPSADALSAAASPPAGSALYFVARGDGTTQFSDTLAEHNRAVREFQLNVRD